MALGLPLSSITAAGHDDSFGNLRIFFWTCGKTCPRWVIRRIRMTGKILVAPLWLLRLKLIRTSSDQAHPDVPTITSASTRR